MVVLEKLRKLYSNSVHWTSTSGHPASFIKFPSCWDILTTTVPLAPPHQGTPISLDAALPHRDTASLGPPPPPPPPPSTQYTPPALPLHATPTSTYTIKHHLWILIHHLHIWGGSAATKYSCSPIGHHVIIRN